MIFQKPAKETKRESVLMKPPAMPEVKPTHFIVVRLGDNDFLTWLIKGLSYACKDYGVGTNICPIALKRFIVEYIVSSSIQHYILCEYTRDKDMEVERKRLADYLESMVRVTFEQHKPETDVDFANAYYDVHLDEVYPF